MKAVNRRLERRSEFIAWLQTNYPGTIDLRQFEQQGMFLEGDLGSLVLDRMNRLAFSALSDRTHPALAERWAKQMGYCLFTFKTKDDRNDLTTTPMWYYRSVSTGPSGVRMQCPSNRRKRNWNISSVSWAKNRSPSRESSSRHSAPTSWNWKMKAARNCWQ